MKRNFYKATTVLLSTLTLSAAVLPCLAEDTLSSEQTALMAGSCANCHGTDGRLVGSVPTIAGRPAAVLEARLLAFKRDEISDTTVMDRIAKGFTNAELAALASHFSAIDPQADDATETEQEPQE
ncbi:cytochrome c, class I [Billgrantia diversa]|uniref:c-type cytochrome n=1 Tax=Halomonas sp. MCCC 1A13316 TaxID=2733487 RepID=UPI0018A57EF7|nr:c-type cytochrome [Halomonas sp. MCCC 1A13316]QOR39847.1 cytochrome c, class I [Halomonas sp. MCCC 1A13316]